MGVKFLRIELDTCFNRTELFIDPIHIQISSNNGILWTTLITITYHRELPHKSWLIDLPNDEAMRRHLVRIRLFQRVTASMSNYNRVFCIYTFNLRMDIELDTK